MCQYNFYQNLDYASIYEGFKESIKNKTWLCDDFYAYLEEKHGIEFQDGCAILSILCQSGLVKHIRAVGPPDCPDMFDEFEF